MANYKFVTGYYVCQENDDVLLVNTADASVQIELSYACMTPGKTLTIKDRAGRAQLFPIAILTRGPALIDGNDKQYITLKWESMTILYDGQHWNII